MNTKVNEFLTRVANVIRVHNNWITPMELLDICKVEYEDDENKASSTFAKKTYLNTLRISKKYTP